MNKKTGFTLIELLVSISIIAILTALLTANFVGVRQRGRDAQRKSNLLNIQSALEFYRADTGAYPLTASFPNCGNPLQTTTGDPPQATAVYMKKVPCDPSTQASFKYISTDGVTYSMYACLENQQDSEISTDPSDTDSITGCNKTGGTSFPYKLVNP